MISLGSFVRNYGFFLTKLTNEMSNFPVYRKVVYKSRGFCALFQLFGAASIQVRLLFEGGFYAKSRVCKTRKHGLANVKWKWNLTLRLFQIYFKYKQTFGMWKAVHLVLHQGNWAAFFWAEVLYESGLSGTWVRRKCGFYSSAASNQVRLLYTTLWYTITLMHNRISTGSGLCIHLNLVSVYWQKA